MKRKQSYPQKYVKKQRTKFIVSDNTAPLVTTRDVARIARSVVKSASETKEFVNYTSVAPVDNTVSVINLAAMTQGTADANVVGEKIHITKIAMRHFLFSNNATSASKQVRLMVFMASNQITGTVLNGVAPSTLFKIVGGTVLPIQPPDGSKITVLRDVVLKLQPTLVSGVVTNLETREYSYEINLNRNYPFQDNNCTYGKNQTLYLAVVGYESATLAQPVGVQTFSSVFYKDT